MAVHVKVMCLSGVCRHGKRPAKAACVCLCGLLVIAIILLTFRWSGFHSNNGRVLDQNDVGGGVIVQGENPSHSQDGQPFVNKTIQNPESFVNTTPNRRALIWRPKLSKVSKVVFIRIHKTASRTLGYLLSKHVPKKRFEYETFPIVVNASVRRDVMNRHHGRIVFSAHMTYMEFQWQEPPIYISMARDPIERVISNFNFEMRSDVGNHHKHPQRDEIIRSTGNNTIPTLSECVLRDLPFCTNYQLLFNTLLYLCGEDPRCMTANNWTYARAVRHIDSSLAGGLTEEFEDYLRVLERLLPGVFKGLSETYHSTIVQHLASFKTKFKEPLSPKAESKLRRKMGLEYRIYNYVRDRFHKIKRRLGIV